MGFGADLFSAITTFGASSFDIGSDLINALDFLGHNVSRSMSEGLSKSLYLRHNLTSIHGLDETSNAESPEIHDVHRIWGALGILIMFFPGIIRIPKALVYLMHGRNMFKEAEKDFGIRNETKLKKVEGLVFQVCAILFYPIAMIFGSISVLFRTFRGKGSEVQKLSTVMVGQEAFFESFPQLLLQCFTIAYGYEVTTVQKVTIFASFFFLARVSIAYDLLWEEPSFKDTMIQTAKLLPAHVTTIMFRVSAFTMTMVYLREWAVIPIFVLYLEILTMAYIKYQSVQDPVVRFRSIWYRSLSNLAVLNVYDPLETHMDEGEKRRCRNFIILSAVTTFVHHVIVITSILMLSFYYPEHFLHERFEKLIVRPGGDQFFYAFSITYALGISSLVLCLHLSARVSNLKVEVLR